jgi:Tol biopolymer transport system component
MYPANVSAAHSQVFKDGIHWVSDQFNGMKLVMFTLGQNKIDETKILFRHGSLWNEQRSHPHPHFSSSGKYILFSKDKTGRAQVCSVKINLDKK